MGRWGEGQDHSTRMKEAEETVKVCPYCGSLDIYKRRGFHPLSRYSCKKGHTFFSPKKASAEIYSCARVYLGSYDIDTNQFMRSVSHGYELLEGKVRIKKLKPILVRTATDGKSLNKLQTLVIYPKTNSAVIRIWAGRRKRLLKLVRPKPGERSTILKTRL